MKVLEDDFNVPYALGVLWDVVRSTIPAGEKLSLIQDFDKVLGLNLGKVVQVEQVVEVEQEVKELVKQREKAREDKDFVKSDELRQKIEDAGYEVKDTSGGTSVNKKN